MSSDLGDSLGIRLGFLYRVDTDVEISYVHANGEQEQMPLRKLVEAYATAMGLPYEERQGEISDINRGGQFLPVEVIRQEGDVFLSFNSLRLQLPAIEKAWGENGFFSSSRKWYNAWAGLTRQGLQRTQISYGLP